jgi:hypothetical protein
MQCISITLSRLKSQPKEKDLFGFRSIGNLLKYIDVLDFEKAIVLNKTGL